MFSAQLYSKLSDEEKRILDTYTERVSQCQTKLKGLSFAEPQDPQYRSFDEELTRPKKVLSTHLIGEEEPMREAPAEHRSVMDMRYEPPEHDTSSRLSSKASKDLADTPKKRGTRPRGKTSNSSSRRASREATPKRSSRQPTPKRTSQERPRSAQGHSPLHKPKTLNLKVIPNLEEEVEKLLKVVYRFAKQSAEMTNALEGGCKLYSQYARAMAAASKRKAKGRKAP